ncbi:hypothetical protein G159_01580 [Planococcus glaciei CHR43]|nr:hypothetical protein G159_01580 [Planococcus glaciei CHR43]
MAHFAIQDKTEVALHILHTMKNIRARQPKREI